MGDQVPFLPLCGHILDISPFALKTQVFVQHRDKRPKLCAQNKCAQFAYTGWRLSVCAFPTRLISKYE